MQRNDTKDDGRAQVGIGTLIVFIAMVLVAAIAAGVLISTADLLQTQAEDTGGQSTEQVADSLNIITSVGEVGVSNDQIAEVRIGVQPSAGADEVNLAELTLQYVSDNDFDNLVVGQDSATGDQANGDANPDNVEVSDSNGNLDDAEYLVDVITAENEGDIIMSDSKDRYEIVVPLGEGSGVDAVTGSNFQNGELTPLQEGESVEVTVTTEAGSQRVAFLGVPDSLSAEVNGDTVNI